MTLSHLSGDFLQALVENHLIYVKIDEIFWEIPMGIGNPNLANQIEKNKEEDGPPTYKSQNKKNKYKNENISGCSATSHELLEW